MRHIILPILICSLVSASEQSLAEALAATGAAQLQKGRVEQAKDAFYRALAHDENCGTALFQLAKIYEKEGLKNDAANLYSRASANLNDAALKKEADSRNKSLNPLAAKHAAIFQEYAKGIEAVARTHQDAVTLDQCAERIRVLNLECILQKEQLPRLSNDNSVNLLALLRSTGAIPKEFETTTASSIISPRGKTKIQIPYSPPEAYEFIVEFVCLEPGVVGIMVPTKSGIWQLFYYSPDRLGFPSRPDMTPKTVLKANEKGTLSVKVKGPLIEAFMNGKFITSTTTPSQAAEWTLSNPMALGFGTQNSRTEFTSIKIIELSGTGKFLK